MRNYYIEIPYNDNNNLVYMCLSDYLFGQNENIKLSLNIISITINMVDKYVINLRVDFRDKLLKWLIPASNG